MRLGGTGCREMTRKEEEKRDVKQCDLPVTKRVHLTHMHVDLTKFITKRVV